MYYNNNNLDIKEYCRICLKIYFKPLISVLSVSKLSERNILIYNALQDVGPFMSEIPDCACLPRNVCEECLNCLLKAYNLRRKCKKINEILMKIVDELNNLKTHNSTNTIHHLYKIDCQYFNKNLQVQVDNYKCTEESVDKLESMDESEINLIPGDNIRCITNDNKSKEYSKEKLRTFNCKKCTKTFKTLSGLVYHKNTHTSDKTYTCNICNKRFFAQKNLDIHKRRHNLHFTHLCPECGKKFLTSTEFSRHIRAHHNEKPFSCPICSKSFTTNISLGQHKLRHAGQKPNICGICDKAFTTRGNLNEHKLSHSSDKPHKCSICDKTWISTSDLKKHLRTHSGEKPYNCKICNKAFARSCTLKIHERTHSGVKPYQCQDCNKMFGHLSSLNKHKKNCISSDIQ